MTTAAPPAAVAATVTAAVTAPSDRRRFELVEGGSAKFWEVARAGREVTVRYGRIGTDGQAKAKTLPDEAAALRHVEGLVREKTGKGYAEV
ncbi:WGR domain-containing protein [Aquisphaera giovannonii]|uniref:WGR domain-containing protein n=1 Tax=Aquisphaera giovannonii TaxID=406548 RepID=UPI0036F298FB